MNPESNLTDSPLTKNKLIMSYRKKLPKLTIQNKNSLILPCSSPDTCTKKKPTEQIKKLRSLATLKDAITDKQWQQYFAVKNKIGEGAHSVVYRCIEHNNNKQYAIKFSKRNDPELLEWMRESYQIMRILDHQYIMKAKFLFIQDKTSVCQVVTDYYPYPTLSKYIKEQQEKIDEKIVADILHKILMAVSYMHKKKVCHRDIKPDNILYNPVTRQMKIIDFQLSRMQRYSTEKLDLWSDTGDIHYRAPQSFHGGYSYPIDVWAIGVIGYRMLIGQLPFYSLYHNDIRNKIKRQTIEFDNLQISKLGKKFLAKLLNKNPNQRITAQQALSDPFLLKQTTRQIITCTSPMNTSFESLVSPDKFEHESTSKYFEQDSMLNFLEPINNEQ